MTVVYPEFAPKVGTQGVHFNPKFEAAVKVLAPNRKCIFKSPVRGCRGCHCPFTAQREAQREIRTGVYLIDHSELVDV